MKGNKNRSYRTVEEILLLHRVKNLVFHIVEGAKILQNISKKHV